MTSDDEQYHAAIKAMRVAKIISTGFLTAKLGLSYLDASTVIERAEREGVITPPQASGKRKFTKPAKPKYTDAQLLSSG